MVELDFDLWTLTGEVGGEGRAGADNTLGGAELASEEGG